MHPSEIRMLMKVVPHAKSHGIPLEKSEEWAKAKANGQPFLYVTEKDDCVYTLGYSKNGVVSDGKLLSYGEYFRAFDFEPYIETTTHAEGNHDAYHVISKNASKEEVRNFIIKLIKDFGL